jgi:hypothetical protein
MYASSVLFSCVYLQQFEELGQDAPGQVHLVPTLPADVSTIRSQENP